MLRKFIYYTLFSNHAIITKGNFPLMKLYFHKGDIEGGHVA